MIELRFISEILPTAPFLQGSNIAKFGVIVAFEAL